ncbi:MAG TPA: metallophosphoesterase [Mucilaginibacter sp.]|jgi:predicted phosphodiesterase
MLATHENIRTRPVFKLAAIDDQEKFKPLPPPSGIYPYHLDVRQVLPDLPLDKMIFHMAGDTGGKMHPEYKHRVATEMISQSKQDTAENQPAFFFHLGDVVYNFGQAADYYSQFFEPYENYPGPIFAIAGNHDGDIDPLDPKGPQSLDGFMRVFCDTKSQPVSFAEDSKRQSNIQPNVYWTLKTPLANIICLYSNVPRFGSITAEQKEWFTEELKSAKKDDGEKALILCIHHAPYSADTNHGSSMPMQLFLNAAFEAADKIPDIVFSGHVHNYQRFNKLYTNGKEVPFIVAGAGGYADLHKIAPTNDFSFPDKNSLLNNVALEKYCDTTHGFLKITLEKNDDRFAIDGAYYTIPQQHDITSQASPYDSFTVNLR